MVTYNVTNSEANGKSKRLAKPRCTKGMEVRHLRRMYLKMSLNLRAIISVPYCVFRILIHRSASRFHHFQLQDSRQHLPLPQMLPLRTCPSLTPMLPHQVPHKTRWSSQLERGCNRNTRVLLVSLPAFSHSNTLIESCEVPRPVLRKRRDLFFFITVPHKRHLQCFHWSSLRWCAWWGDAEIWKAEVSDGSFVFLFFFLDVQAWMQKWEQLLWKDFHCGHVFFFFFNFLV